MGILLLGPFSSPSPFLCLSVCSVGLNSNDLPVWPLFLYLEGKLLKEMDAPIKERSIFSFYPFAIKDGKVFKLLENEGEKWELHVTDIQ